MKPKWYSFILKEGSDFIDIFFFDVIGWETTASQFVAEFSQLPKGKKLNIHINSPGGDVFDGIAIYNILKDYAGEKTVIVEGIAASIASVIAMAGDKIQMQNTSMMMIHKPWVIAIGDSKTLKKEADVLDKIQGVIVKAYQTKSSLTDKELQDLIDAETWMDAEDTLEYELATEIIEAPKEEKDSFDNRILSFQNREIFDSFKAIPHKIAALINPKEQPKAKFQMIDEKNGNHLDTTAKTVVINLNTETLKPKGNVMTPEEIAAQKLAEEKKIKDAADAAAKDAVKVERDRQKEIRASGKILNIAQEIVDKAIEDGITVAEAGKTFIAEVAKNTQNVGTGDPKIKIGLDEGVKFRNATVSKLLVVKGLIRDVAQKAEALKNDVPKSLHGLMRTCLERAGVRGVSGMEPAELIKAIFDIDQGTGDFTSICEDTVNKSFAAGQEQANSTYRIWTKDASVKDFNQASRIKLSSFADIETIPEGEAPKSGSFSDKKEVGTLKTGGKKYNLSRQALINDNLGAMTEVVAKMGISLERAVERECYNMLYAGGTPGSGAVGPVMLEDTLRLFDATATVGHGNFVDSGAVVSNTTLDVGYRSLRTMKLAKGNPSDADDYTNLTPRYLLISAVQEATCKVLTTSMSYPAATWQSNTPNPYSGLQLVVAPALYGKDSGYPWYLAADQNEIDTLIRLTLNGSSAPIIQSENNMIGEALGITYQIVFDWTWMVGDWRGLFKNDGH